MGWSMTKQKRKKKRKKPFPSDEFRHVKSAKRERMIAERNARKLTQAQLGKMVIIVSGASISDYQQCHQY